MLTSNSTTVADSEITYDRLTKDYAVIVAGEIIGYAANYRDAEQVRTAALAARGGSVWSGAPVECTINCPGCAECGAELAAWNAVVAGAQCSGSVWPGR